MPQTDPRTAAFVSAIESLEKSGDAETLMKRFTHDVELASIAFSTPLAGMEAAKKFWVEYVSLFKTVQTRFTHIHSSGDLAVLEWHSQGELKTGLAIDYRGVTVLEFTGPLICRFRVYYDSAAFIEKGAKLLGRVVQSV